MKNSSILRIHIESKSHLSRRKILVLGSLAGGALSDPTAEIHALASTSCTVAGQTLETQGFNAMVGWPRGQIHHTVALFDTSRLSRIVRFPQFRDVRLATLALRPDAGFEYQLCIPFKPHRLSPKLLVRYKCELGNAAFQFCFLKLKGPCSRRSAVRGLDANKSLPGPRDLGSFRISQTFSCY